MPPENLDPVQEYEDVIESAKSAAKTMKRRALVFSVLQQFIIALETGAF